mgnify:CR=1 FL=1
MVKPRFFIQILVFGMIYICKKPQKLNISYKKNALLLMKFVKASTLPSYTSNLSIKREGKMSDRVILPINEEEAHVTYYVVMLKKIRKI